MFASALVYRFERDQRAVLELEHSDGRAGRLVGPDVDRSLARRCLIHDLLSCRGRPASALHHCGCLAQNHELRAALPDLVGVDR